ncbi:Zn-ribbon domain-containing OB-fold protein [Hyphomonas johnsonii]|uniref:ChsH2 C-terminal OB-fold domain-containing protein n=1 Tax=Hyphomonas johnsonii MHS-2 TaxID=1280950 RepID=A0A059FRB8_9PROT|nr:OB-fold domain-containing protein [Hyphomonas johnsonii]KCZ93219.1 hypothetical protein HJO_05170 [Hyphomonas johnsonii MHS-2]
MTDTDPALPLPAMPFIKVEPNGVARLEFQKCTACGAFSLETNRIACGKCGARGSFVAHQPETTTGTLHSYSIVHRSFPGVAVPFVSAIVDMDNGPSLKGNLRGIAQDPESISLGMAVNVVLDDALNRKDDQGNSYVCHFFEPIAAK